MFGCSNHVGHHCMESTLMVIPCSSSHGCCTSCGCDPTPWNVFRLYSANAVKHWLADCRSVQCLISKSNCVSIVRELLRAAKHWLREHDPWSRGAPGAPLQQNPPLPFSHHCLFIMTPLFSPLVTSYWNSTSASALFKSLWTAAPSCVLQVCATRRRGWEMVSNLED